MAIKKMLIVDDEPSFAETLKPFFEMKGIMVLTSISGEEAISVLEKEKPEVILLDMLLKGDMDGMGVLKEVRRLAPEAKVIMLTGLDGGPKFEALKLGAVAYLNKPITTKVLLETIEKALS